MALQNAFGDLALDSNLVALLSEFRNRFDAVQTSAVTATIAGQTVVIDATASQALRVVWVYVQADADVTGSVVVTLRLGSRVLYKFDLIGSQPFAHSAVHEGALGEDLTIELDQSVIVYCNADYRIAA